MVATYNSALAAIYDSSLLTYDGDGTSFVGSGLSPVIDKAGPETPGIAKAGPETPDVDRAQIDPPTQVKAT